MARLKHDAVDDAGVSQFIGKYVIAAADERRYDARIGKKSAAEDQGLGISLQSGNHPLQLTCGSRVPVISLEAVAPQPYDSRYLRLAEIASGWRASPR